MRKAGPALRSRKRKSSPCDRRCVGTWDVETWPSPTVNTGTVPIGDRGSPSKHHLTGLPPLADSLRPMANRPANRPLPQAASSSALSPTSTDLENGSRTHDYVRQAAVLRSPPRMMTRRDDLSNMASGAFSPAPEVLAATAAIALFAAIFASPSRPSGLRS